MIKEIEIGEIVRINSKEYLLTETAIGGCDKKRATLLLLKNVLKGIYRIPYFKKQYKSL